MGNASYATQTNVYFKKIARIAMREKAWIYILFAVVIALIVNLVTAEEMFKNLDSTKSGFFTLASACIWIGVFNSIQSICKEHNIIRSEYRQGTKLSSYVSAHILWQAVLCLVQAIIIFTVCVAFGFFGKGHNQGVNGNQFVGYFITIFILTFGASVLGLMVSSFSGTPTTAMKIMPFVLIIQLILSGVLFELKGFANTAAGVTYSKWGMSALGSIGNINSLDSKIAQELAGNPTIPKGSLVKTDALFNNDMGTLMAAWGWCIALTALFAVISVISLKLKNKDS